MPPRSSDKKAQRPVVSLRRSPRFLQVKLPGPENPKTPILKQEGRTHVASSETPLTSTGNKKVSSRRISRKPTSQECSQALGESGECRRSSDNPKTGLRRSRRLNPCADECSAEKLSRSSNGRDSKWELERRAMHRGRADKSAERSGYGGSTASTGNGSLSGEYKNEEGVNASVQFKGKSSRDKMRHSKRRGDDKPDGFDECESEDHMNKGVLSITEQLVLDEVVSEKCIDERANGRVGVVTAMVVHAGKMEGRDVNEMRMKVGVKRKRDQSKDIVGIAQGWTKDQESALETAYLIVKPTPHFWKKVSRLVPGKSAQECFDKIHGSHLTPPQLHPRCRSRVSKSQNPSFSASKLLNSSDPMVKRPRCRRQKSHVVQRTVRHMLQKQYTVEQDSEADLFAVLEPTFTQPLHRHPMVTTPDRNQETGEILKRCQERSSTARKKSLSRFNSSCEATLMSPPVLKQVKNKALHDKYIDQLHCREASRKAACAKAEKLHRGQGMKQDGSVERRDAIKAAKNALVFDARDAINKFQHQQATALINSFEDDSGAENDEGKGEGVI